MIGLLLIEYAFTGSFIMGIIMGIIDDIDIGGLGRDIIMVIGVMMV